MACGCRWEEWDAPALAAGVPALALVALRGVLPVPVFVVVVVIIVRMPVSAAHPARGRPAAAADVAQRRDAPAARSRCAACDKPRRSDKEGV
jgi:hypothetical protein